MGAGQSNTANGSVTGNSANSSNTGMVVTSTNSRRNTMRKNRRNNGNGMNPSMANAPMTNTNVVRSNTTLEEPVNNAQKGGKRRKSRKSRKGRKGSRKHSAFRYTHAASGTHSQEADEVQLQEHTP